MSSYSRDEWLLSQVTPITLIVIKLLGCKSIFIAESSVVKILHGIQVLQFTGSGVSLLLVVDAGVVLEADPLLPVVPLGDDIAPEVKEERLKEER